MSDRIPRAHADPHVVARLRYNGSTYRIVAYDASRTFGGPTTPTDPCYALQVDVQEENAMGETVWRACGDRDEDRHTKVAKDYLLEILLGLRQMGPDDHIEPRDRLGRYYRVTWGPGPSHFDPEVVARGGQNYGTPYPLAETVWAPTRWAARSIFEAMHGPEVLRLWGLALAAEPRRRTTMPTPVANPWYDPDVQEGTLVR